MKETIYKCDICFAECDPDMMLHSASERDVCVGCLEKLVDEHFAKMHKFEDIIESASAMEPMTSKKAKPVSEQKEEHDQQYGTGHNTILTKSDEDEIRRMRKSGMTEKAIKSKFHISHKVLVRVIGGQKPEYDWGKAQALRNAGWSMEKIASEIGCTAPTVKAHTKKPDKKANRQHEWITDDLNRLGGEA